MYPRWAKNLVGVGGEGERQVAAIFLKFLLKFNFLLIALILRLIFSLLELCAFISQ